MSTCRWNGLGNPRLLKTHIGDDCPSTCLTCGALERISNRMFIEDRGHETPCWISTYAPNRQGYTLIKVRPDPVSKLVHRYVYQALVGEIPDGLVLDHLCRQPACFNPSHLEPVTLVENVLRGESAIAQYARATHCVRGHVFDEKNTRVTKRGRECRKCDVIRNTEARKRKRAA